MRWHVLAWGTLSTLLLGGEAHADWPMARHDSRRTGSADGVGNMTTPAPYWRYFAGGTLTPANILADDVNGDGQNDIVYVTGGRAVVREASGSVIWTSAPLDLTSLDGLVDLDGDGTLEVVVHSRPGGRAYVLDSSGAIAWAESAGEMGTIGAVRIADFSGDNLPDLLVIECGCCAVVSGETAVAYGFSNGAHAPTRLWKLPRSDCGSYSSTTVFDADGDGDLELLHGLAEEVVLVDGTTGAEIASITGLPTWIQRSQCLTTNVDDDNNEEVLCAFNRAGKGHGLYLFSYDSEEGFVLDWSAEVGDEDGRLLVQPEVVTDFDDDGLLEIVAGGVTASGEDVAEVIDAQTGALLGTLVGHTLAGTVRLDDSGALLLTENDDIVTAWRVNPEGGSLFEPIWSLLDRSPLMEVDPHLNTRCSLSSRVVAPDVNGDGFAEYVGRRDYAGDEIVVYRLRGSTPRRIAGYALTEGSAASLVKRVPLEDDGNQLLVLSSDGELHGLDAFLRPLPWFGTADSAGFRVGGFYSSGGWRALTGGPVVGQLDGENRDSVLITTSSGRLVRLDTSAASLSQEPQERWSIADAWSPAIVPELDGQPGVACFGLVQPVSTPPRYQVMALRPTGSVAWARELPNTPFNDVVPGQYPAGRFLAVQWGPSSESTVVTTAFDLGTGSLVWEQTTDPFINRQPSGATVVDFDADGADDVIHAFGGIRLIDGSTGLETSYGQPSISYGMATPVNVDSDDNLELLVHASLTTLRVLDSNLSTALLQSTDNERPLPHAAVTECGDELVAVSASWIVPPRLKVTQLTGTAAGQESLVVLAGGEAYDSEADAIAANGFVGQLTSPSIHRNLSGAGHPSALVGSSDGWLYAVNPCSLQVDFVHDFGASVGAVAFGDTDGDSLDEVVVSVSDGYVYGLKQLGLATPTWANDIPSSTADPTVDIDELLYAGSLYAAWNAVEGADSYEVSVVASDGVVETDPPWLAVGGSTVVEIPLPDLDPSFTYQVAVRAISGDLVSPDISTDGVALVESAGGGAGGMGGAGGSGGNMAGAPAAGGKDGGAAGIAGAGGDSDAVAGAAGTMGGEGGLGRVSGGANPDAAGAGGEKATTQGWKIEGGGCGCRARRGPAPAGVWGSLLVFLFALSARRKRRRTNQTPRSELH